MLKTKNSLLLVTAIFSLFLSGCSKKQEKRLVIWTDNSEFAPYIEIFNETHKNKAVLVYKANLADSLPPSSEELQPDIIAGSWLKNSKIRKNFTTLDYLFNRKYLSSSDFYPVLLKNGTVRGHQYLLPVNFNIPAMIFSKENKRLVEDNYTISLDQLRTAGSAFNKKNKKGKFTAIGFAPQSSVEFMYVVAKMKGTNFREDKGNSFTYNRDALNSTLSYLTDWIITENSSTQTESDFVYKYLSVTPDKRVISGRTLFAYITSDKLFSMDAEQLSKIDFRWLNDKGLIPVEDSMLQMGIAKKSKKEALASDFISWFFSSETQHDIIERKFKMNLDTVQFGIAGGFSALKDVNEHILPVYYTEMMTNIPQSGTFITTDRKPSTWDKIKKRVILPYIAETIENIPGKKISSIEERYSDLKKLGM